MKENDGRNNRKGQYLLAFFFNSFLICIFAIYEAKIGTSFGVALSYSSPFVVGNAICIFGFFQSFSMGSLKFVNNLAKGSLTMYLIHTYFLPYLNIAQFVVQPLVILFIHLIVCGIIIYCISYIVYVIYEKCTRPIWNWIEKHEWSIELK